MPLCLYPSILKFLSGCRGTFSHVPAVFVYMKFANISTATSQLVDAVDPHAASGNVEKWLVQVEAGPDLSESDAGHCFGFR